MASNHISCLRIHHISHILLQVLPRQLRQESMRNGWTHRYCSHYTCLKYNEKEQFWLCHINYYTSWHALWVCQHDIVRCLLKEPTMSKVCTKRYMQRHLQQAQLSWSSFQHSSWQMVDLWREELCDMYLHKSLLVLWDKHVSSSCILILTWNEFCRLKASESTFSTALTLLRVTVPFRRPRFWTKE